MTGGTIKIRAKDDAIDSVRSVTISNADVKVSVGGKDIKCEGTLNIAEGCLGTLDAE
ncbi:MAG TPA: carbohydrate-binding domain-containing protein [Acetivibrio sp.]|uniref:hypothetical protein n=1 Tax=Acetivibrio sp. TaxID=1872092 RepID=UPI002D0C653F|nr:hypothetical protein [Acetivibrio sp.]HOM03386.1 carbohydrate-binding domain-containing protein [Acetivibrio sp.]